VGASPVLAALQGTFGIVLFVVVVVAAIVAVVILVGRSDIYDQIGRGGLSLHEDSGQAAGATPRPAPQALDRNERDDEIRQMLQARNERRLRRGEAPIDIDAELARLTGPAATSAPADPDLVEEIRQHVIARNERRARQGKQPLDVEVEVQRQLRELGAGA
jgi:hypothetical protein